MCWSSASTDELGLFFGPRRTAIAASDTGPSLELPLEPLPVPTEAQAQPPATTGRLGAIDLFRGVAILEVVFHHVTSYVMRQINPESTVFFLTALANRTLHFAVPGFLFMTGLIFTRSSLRREFRLGPYYLGRVTKTLVPYLIWSVLYALFVVAITPRTIDQLDNLALWERWLLNGKAYYHLYFLFVALQFYAVFPLVLPIFRRRPSPLITVLVLVALQLVIYWANRLYVRTPFTASYVPWYVLPIGLGMLVGAHFDRWPEFWRRWRLAVLALAALGWALYLPPAYLALVRVPVNTFAYSSYYWLFSSAFALLLFGVCGDLARRRPAARTFWRPDWLAPLALLGANSLQVYLIHPAVIAYLDNVRNLPNVGTFVGFAALYVVTLSLPLGFALLVKGSALSKLLFGR